MPTKAKRGYLLTPLCEKADCDRVYGHHITYGRWLLTPLCEQADCDSTTKYNGKDHRALNPPLRKGGLRQVYHHLQ